MFKNIYRNARPNNNQLIKTLLIDNLEKRLEMITKWLKGSGLVVNEFKTEICLFHYNDQPLISIMLEGARIMSKKSMNVLGVVFDSKLNCSTHVAQTIVKANKALIALRLIKRFFSISEMRTLFDANIYSILWQSISEKCAIGLSVSKQRAI